MTERERPPLSVHFLPAHIPPGSLKGGLAVVIDVLRATTSMVHALSAGCEAVVPCGEIDRAREVASTYPRGRAVLAGERQGLKIGGFDLGNSPREFAPEAVDGKVVVMTTTNGTRAILASLEAERVFVAGFVNLSATARALREDGRPVHLVCAGTDGRISFEDSLLAGALAEELWNRYELSGNDEAMIAVSSWYDIDSHDGTEGGLLLNSLNKGWGGRRLRELGLTEDIEDAACTNRFDLVAELQRDPLQIVATARRAR